MKTRIWALGLVLMMALLVGANATTAEAVSFSYTFSGCDGDTICLTPVYGGTPDSIRWSYSGLANAALDIIPPFDTCFVWAGAATGRDSIVMHAWYAAVDSTAGRAVLVSYMEAVDDGRDVDENDSVLVNVLVNDTSSTPDTNVVIVLNPGTNGPFHGTAYVEGSMIWYVPDANYNGTDIFAYRVTNECGQTDTAVVAITIESDGFLDVECGDLAIIQHVCDNDCGGTCDEAPSGSSVSLGDSVRFCVNISEFDLDELTAGWPRIDLPGIAGTNIVMQENPNDSTEFCWPGFDADSTPAWYVIDDGSLDVVENIYRIIVRARSTVAPNLIVACTTVVPEAIDNEGPEIGAGEASWTLWHDVDGNGIVTTVDTMRLFIDLRNEPFEEICQVSVTLYGFPSVDDTGSLATTHCLHEIAGDNRWAVILTGSDLAGDLEDVDGPFTAVFHYWDNACNEDSTDAEYNGPVDNTAPECRCIEWVYEAVDDINENGCIGLGEGVRISVRDTCNGDISEFYVDLFSDTSWRFGLGVGDPADSSHRRFLLPSIGGGWYGVEWVLGQYPLENAIDTTASEDVVPWVFLHAEDDAGNQLNCGFGPDSLALVWTDIGINIDARAPSPVRIDSCQAAETFTGRRAVRIYFTDTANGAGFQDIARFRMFYDNGTGVIDYVDTLAGLNWDDTLGGTGTDGLVHVGPDHWYWTTDGTVELSECRDYLFNIWVIDDCDNLESSHPDSILCMGDRPDPVVDLECSPEDDLNICLEWTTYETSADSFHIYMASDGRCDTAIWVGSVPFTDTGITYEWCTDDAGLDLIEYRWYDFIVLTFDSCGNVQDEYPEDCEDEYSYVTRCFADMAPPVVCIFQPASLAPGEDTTIYSCDRCTPFLGGSPSDGMYIYTRPCNDTSLDVTSIDTVLVRIADSAGTPGEWHAVDFDTATGPNHWQIVISCEDLNSLVREDDSVEVLQVMVISTDAADRMSTREQVETCCGFFEFVWSAYYVDVYVNTVNGEVQTYQTECGAHGFGVDGLNEVEICIEAGTPPYKIRMSAAPSGDQWADEFYHQVVYVENVFATCTTLTFSSIGWEAGLGELDVEVCDAAGHYSDETEIPLCVPDTIPACALISNPVDGKCIRRSLSMIDPVQVCIEIDPAGTSLDPDNILKIDYQWSQECCVGFVIDTICFDTACPPPAGFPDGSVCTTFANPNNPFFGTTRCYPTVGNPIACTVYAATNNLDSTICWEAQADTSCTITICRLIEVPCEDVFEWETFAIQPGTDLEGPFGCVDWWNTEDLAWVTESGTIIYLRAIVYDEFGNVCYTPCVQVCVDIDTPPLCLWTPDICPSNGYMAIGGNEEHLVTFVAELDLTQGNVDDLEDVVLWFKKSTDPDLLGYWCEVGSGFFGEYSVPGGTNSTVWRWDLDMDDTYGGCGFQDGISYDFRVIGHTIWGTYSWDYNGDGAFDANTFDSSECDMNTYYIDLTAPQVAMDTVWTMVNGELIVQPNVSCALSDPRGWAWTQFGNEMTIQPSVYPWTGQGPEYLNFKDDVKRVRWTLYDDSHNCECSDDRGQNGSNPFLSGSCFDDECDCVSKGGNGDYCDYDGTSDKGGNGNSEDPWVVSDIQGSNPMQNLTFNPANAPWWDDQWTGVQTAVLLVEVWDSCGNRTQDCITLYLLDADPTDAIIVEPMNDEVFCTEPGNDAYNGIEIRSAAILEEGWNKAVYAYRAVGATDWIEFDSVGLTPDPDMTWQTQWNEVMWNPVANGLPNGSYELTVWAVDNALNRSENLYIITVHLSCAAPVVSLLYPTSEDPSFIGCPIELIAEAYTSDPRNPIVRVNFFAVRVIDDLGEADFLGFDLSTIDGRYGWYWEDPDIEGPYYLYAEAENLTGQVTRSELVWVKGDDTDPWARVAQVGDDLSNGNLYNDPTVLQAGETVDIWGFAKDVDGDWGYGEVDNCGVDSVIFYVRDDEGENVFGAMMEPDNTIDSLYHTMWNTTGLPVGEYFVYMRVFDCACNEDMSLSWNVVIEGPDNVPTLEVDGMEICGYISVDDYAEITVTYPNPEYVDYFEFAYSHTSFSDVEDQYDYYGEFSAEDGGTTLTFDASILGDFEITEGIWRLRVVTHYTDGTVSEDGDDDGVFDDFTFNAELPHHELIRIDHSVTPFEIVTESGGTTFKAHESICFSVVPQDTCDFDHVHVCATEDHDSPGDSDERDTIDVCFNPVDSSCVTLSNCGVWGGSIPMTVCDAFGHCEESSLDIWILDVAGPDTTLITSPSMGDYLTPSNSNVLTARKLSVSGVDSVQFFRSAAQAGASTYIGSAIADGDEFTYEWDVEGVAEGSYYIYTRSFDDGVGVDGPRCVNITVAKGCESFALMVPNPSYTRDVNGQTITFVGDRTDLCIDRELISSITNGVGIDSVVWFFRQASAPGVFPYENEDPFDGYVRIASDRFGSLCIDWWTDWCQYGYSYGDDYWEWLNDYGWSDTSSYSDCCSDGRYTVVAYVYDKAGNVCHSVPTVVSIDNADPYSEVVDIDGDETFGDCHPIVLPGDSVIKVTANAIDLTCSEGSPNEAYASGAKYLQFFAGGCGSSGAGPIDILFVVDGSNSMRYSYYASNNINTLAAAAGTFTSALSGRNVQYGVIGFSGEVEHDCESNLAGQSIDVDGTPTFECDGIWTSNPSDLTNMLFGVASTELPYVGGQNDNNYEFGLQAIRNGLGWYDWRPGASRVIILVTDEDDDPTVLGSNGIDLSFIEASGATVYTILNQTATTGYHTLAPNTGGQTYEWNSNLGATFGALTSAILSGSNYEIGDVGIVWGKQVTLTDGQDNAFALWNVTGLEPGEYCVWTKVIDQIGNVYESDRVSVCIEDRTPPTAYIAGFGMSTDDHMKHEYTIYGQSWDTDIDYVQFQYRPAGSTSQTDWTGIGIPIAVGCDGDNTLWMTKWNPCVLSGTFQMRVVPTDENGNQDHDIQPIATVTISDCGITPAAASASASAVWFEDKTFEDLGLVHLDMDGTADNYHNSMIAVWADLHGDLESECIDLYAPDPDQPGWLSGSFNSITSIKMGGEGWFWQAYTDNNNVTHLEKEVVTVWPIRADIGGCNSTHPTLGAKVCVDAGALSQDNGIIVFPARVPVVNWSQQHYQAWPAATSPRFQLVTAIRLTNPICDDNDEDYYDWEDCSAFNLGKYAKVTIKYREPSLDNRNLTVGWWNGDQWDIEHGMLPASAIDDTSGAVYTTNLHGLYAIVSAGRQCIPGAITVENAGMEKAVGNVTGPWPTIYTRVRSNIEFNNGNWDLDEDQMTVVLDGNVTLMANGDDADNDWYETSWDHVTGILTVNWIGPDECLTDDDYDSYDGYEGGGDSYDGLYAPALTAGTHTLYVQAFSDAGYCAENTFTFTVDRSSPNVEVYGDELCTNPTFRIKITDEGSAGVDWENVFVDVFDITGSEYDALPKSRLIHTETYDAFNEELDMTTGEFSFTLVSHIAQGRRLRIVVYIGDRYVYYNSDCNCEYVEYDHDCDGVQDLVGNRTQIVEEQYTIWGGNCGDGGGGGIDTVIVSSGSNNPFDPWNGQTISFDLQGFCEGGSAHAEVYDVAGVKVRDLSTGGFQNPISQVEWNGTNQDEEYVAQGVYLVHFTCTGGSAGGSRSQIVKVVVKRGSGSASN